MAQIHELIGTAIGKIGAISKDKKNPQQGFMYRGIDQVYNALNPVMAELGIFFCPEVIDQKREERVTQKGAILTYTLLTMRFTAYAPDGSNVSMTVVGEGMDSGDKSSNKAMSVAMKYAMFQLFCIPTEEMKDPDADVYQDILPRGKGQQAKPAAQVSTGTAVPPTPSAAAAPAAPQPETGASVLKQGRDALIQELGAGFDFGKARAELIAAGEVPSIPSAVITAQQARDLIAKMRGKYAGKAG